MKSIGEKITPILKEIESTLWEYEVEVGSKPNFPPEALKSATKIFSAVLFDKIFELQKKENINLEDSSKMAYKCGLDIKKLIKIYSNIDTTDFYK